MTVPSSAALAGRVIVWSGPAFTSGAWFGGVDGDDDVVAGGECGVVGCEAQRVACPAAEKLAVVSIAVGVGEGDRARPGHLRPGRAHGSWRVGRPSSVTVPSRLAFAGSVIVWSGPAFTFGA